MFLEILHYAGLFHYINHIRNIIRVTENVICHIRRWMSKTKLFRATKWPPDFARLNSNCIIIYYNYFGMTVTTDYIPNILVPNIL